MSDIEQLRREFNAYKENVEGAMQRLEKRVKALEDEKRLAQAENRKGLYGRP